MAQCVEIGEEFLFGQPLFEHRRPHLVGQAEELFPALVVGELALDGLAHEIIHRPTGGDIVRYLLEKFGRQFNLWHGTEC